MRVERGAAAADESNYGERVCGICGVIQVDGPPRPLLSPRALDRMTDALTHRGPDDRGTHQQAGVALGVRRLSIIDVKGGHQPVASEDGHVWAIQNGELYNHTEVRSRLAGRGHIFASRCDTEILPHLYEEAGDTFPELLRGKFAIALWDARNRRAILVRDRLGVKPLYYARVGDAIAFASELKSLLASGLVNVELDAQAIEIYLTLGYFPGETTPLLSVRKLLPGHLLVAEQGTVTIRRYWDLPYPSAEDRETSEAEWAERFLAELEEAVRLRLMSDVPLGAMLSGGLDSSLIVALMARNMNAPVHTFSVGFPGPANELEDARLVAQRFGTNHHELELSLSEPTLSLEELAWSLDEPLADLSSLGFHLLSRLAAGHVTVALAGQGADELLGGYPSHRNAALAGRLRRVPAPLLRLAGAAGAFAPRRARRAAALLTTSEPTARFLLQHTLLDDSMRSRVLVDDPSNHDASAAAGIVARMLDGHGGDPLAETLYLSTRMALVDDMLQYFDRTSMANSLEVRVPFLDHRVVELCAQIPNRFKVRDLSGKHLLRVAARNLVPDQIIDKKKIGFFNQSVAQWFQTHASKVVSDYLLEPSPAYERFARRTEVEALVRKRAGGGSPDADGFLLALLMLEIWLTTTVPRALGRESAPVSWREPDLAS